MNRDGFILFIPGTVRDPKGNRFWNAMDYCCNHFQLPVDDVGFLKSSIEEVIKTYKVDPERVYLLGHSNGAMMAHRMACEHADLFAGIASLAGSGMQNPADCKPSSPVSILEIHAENDHTVLYDGMTEESLADRLERKPLYPYSSIAENVRYPSSRATIEDWVNKDGCAMALSKTEKHVNYALNAIGAETTKTRWKAGCRNGTEVSFWSLSHGRHVPLFNRKFKDDIVDFLLRQKKQLARQ